MALRRLQCPICSSINKLEVKRGQKNIRCSKCTRMVRVLSAPRVRRTKEQLKTEKSRSI